jgi:hypothetical protein
VEDRHGIQPYLDLLDLFLAGGITADEFETRYLRRYKADDTRRPDKVFTVLDGLFADVDAYVGDPTLRDPGDLDAEQLRECAAVARRRLAEHR